ncbi:MAG: TetR/AcrR family transcriptional regulator [Marinilabiliaceae bacterium]|nr:TetR/AcrR family transcriptional regulator [Marinilabiliaceae bacterium]
MAIKKEKVSKELILEAARNVFIEKGFDGARMQQIADRAGANKALLHYYFSTKESLFEDVFKEAFSTFAPHFHDELLKVKSFKSFLVFFLDIYIKLLLNHPYLPLFILSELQRNPDKLAQIVKGIVDFELIQQMIKKEMDDGNVVKMDVRELIVNILSLCIFPFAGRPMMQRVLWKNDEVGYVNFLNQRAESIYKFLESTLFINN